MVDLATSQDGCVSIPARCSAGKSDRLLGGKIGQVIAFINQLDRSFENFVFELVGVFLFIFFELLFGFGIAFGVFIGELRADKALVRR